MMGEPVGRQDRLFYDIDLEDVAPAGHLLRRIDAVLDLSWLRVEGSEVDWSDVQRASRPMSEYLVALEIENPPTTPKQKLKAMSPSDLSAAWTTRGRHKVVFGYSLNYLIDMEGSVILDVEATPTRISKEVDATETMIERTEERVASKPKRLAGNVAYGTCEMLGWLVERKIDPHIPVWDKSERDDGTFMRADFAYDSDRNVYICPAGKTLTPSGRMSDGKTIYYRASKRDCNLCLFKMTRCPKSPEPRLSRDINEPARDHTRTLMKTKAYRISRAERKKIETLFGEAKHILSMVRLRLRGLTGAGDEFLLTATVQNLKRFANHTTRPPPQPIMA